MKKNRLIQYLYTKKNNLFLISLCLIVFVGINFLETVAFVPHNNNATIQTGSQIPIKGKNESLKDSNGVMSNEDTVSSYNKINDLTFSQFRNEETQKNIQTAIINNDSITGTLKNGANYIVNDMAPQDEVNNLLQSGADVSYGSKSLDMSVVLNILSIGIFAFALYSLNRKSNKINPLMGKTGLIIKPQKENKADGKINDNTITFDSIAGIEEAKSDVVQIVDFLKNPAKFSKLGGKIPRGILMVGPPGTGKTLLAKAIANEANVPFIYKSGSEFVEMFVGVGAGRVRQMFEKAAKEAPCIIFIDEIDSLGGKRSSGGGASGGNDEKSQTLNEFLVQMDGFQVNNGILVIGATNRVDILDPALLRPGRFDRQIFITLPDIKGRKDILDVHSKKIILSEDVDIFKIAKGTPGFSGADLANLVNESAILAANHNFEEVKMEHFEKAKDKIMLGSERKTYMMTPKDKDITAYHEAGHVLCAIYNEHSDPIYKATIIPRGRSLGMVMRLPENDGVSQSKAKLKGELVVAMGGRAAEELIFGKDNVTTGASGDIKTATSYARRMITDWGFSEEIGHVYIPSFNNAFTEEHKVSAFVAETVDRETKLLIEEAKSKALSTIIEHRDQLETIANALKEKESLTGEEILVLCGMQKDLSRTEKQTGI